MAGEHFSGLLNLAAAAAGLSLAYIGLDKFTLERTEIEFTRKKLQEDMREKIQPVLQQLVEVTKKTKESRDRINQPESARFEERLVLLHYLAGLVPPSHRTTLRLILMRFWYAPPYTYFNRGWDIAIFLVLSALSTLSFLVMSAGTVWEMRFLDNIISSGALFVFFTFVTFLVIWHAFMQRQISAAPNSFSDISADFSVRAKKLFPTKNVDNLEKVGGILKETENLINEALAQIAKDFPDAE
jgi:hypothetical protein